jgi:hypothetical protein
MTKQLELIGGFHVGPLFIIQKKRGPKIAGTVMPGRYRRSVEHQAIPSWCKPVSGGEEVWIKYKRAQPKWADTRAIREMWKESKRLTAATGIQHSVDHIVPLTNPIVCGLHWEGNMRVIPLEHNLKKSNNIWPDMPNEQIDLFGD